MAFRIPVNNKFLNKPYCTISGVYDDRHLAKYGTKCRARHHLYRWEARLETKGTLISDSICKWVSGLPFLQVQASPGLKTESALRKIVYGDINVHDFEFLILHLSTNDVENLDQTLAEFEINMMRLTSCIQQSSPYVTIGVSGILPRPQDMVKERAEELLEHRVDMNKIIRDVCQRRHYYFLEIWEKFENADGSPNRDLYANDMLHPNLKGINVLHEYYQGAMGAIMGKKYASE